MSTSTAIITSATSTTSISHHVNRRRDPATAALVFLVAATVLLRPVTAMPVTKDIAANFDSWWYNACGHHGVQQNSRSSNNSCADLGDTVPKSSKIQVRQQMKIFMGNFKNDLKNINSTYIKILKDFKSKKSLEWLPEFKKPEKPSKTVLVKYHADLQIYVVAVHYLATLNLTTDAEFSWVDNRKPLLTKLSNNMKSLLCEIETAVNATCQEVPERVAASYVQKKGLKDLHQITDVVLLDWNVISSFHKFMNHSKKLVRFLPVHKELDSDESEEHSPAMSTEAGGE